MYLPALFFGIVLSTAYGTAFHFWKGGGLNKLFFFVLLAWEGFWIGHFFGGHYGWSFFAVGSINTGMATLCSAVTLLGGEWLSRIQANRK
ncbi:MAG: hypothetical protein WCE68_14120 [Anaerolineales bacterium]